MNERIKQLAEKAGFVLWGEETWNPGDAIDWSSGYDEELNKFAQLIVKECMEINKQELSFTAFERLMHRYQEHFGIE
jgi:hypothetical protein